MVEWWLPSDIAFSQSGETVFVVDADNHRVQARQRRQAQLIYHDAVAR